VTGDPTLTFRAKNDRLIRMQQILVPGIVTQVRA
jgi:hypothetical protein